MFHNKKIDRQIILLLLFRSWAVLAGAVTLIVIPFGLTSIEQGYYFTFLNLTGLQVFFELGLAQIIIQFISHEYAKISIKENGEIVGTEETKKRFLELGKLFIRWYMYAAPLFFFITTIIGIVVLSGQDGIKKETWMPIWVLLVFLTSLTLWILPRLAILEGCGMIATVSKIRLVQSVAGFTLLWILLIFNFGLYCTLAVPFCAFLISFIFVRKVSLLTMFKSYENDTIESVKWKDEIWPLQSKIAISWISGYFVFQIFGPMTFAWYGPEEAGRLGMGIMIFTAIQWLALSLVNAKAPKLTALASLNRREEMNSMFSNLLNLVIVGICVFVTAFIAIAFVLDGYFPEILRRIPDFDILIVLGVGAIANTVVAALAVYLRCERREPLLLVSVLSGAVTFISSILLIRYGVFWMMLGYTTTILVVTLPWTFKLYTMNKIRPGFLQLN